MKKLFFTIVLVLTIALGGVLAYSIWKAAPVTAQAYFESGKKYYDQKKYPEATIQLLNAVRKDARNREARYLLALSFIGQKDVAQAAAQLRALLEYYPDDIPANVQLGGLYLTAGRTTPDLFRQAQDIARKVLNKDPNNVGALLLFGNASAGLQDYSTSVDYFEKALSLDPQNSSIFVSLGTSQTLQKNYVEAEQAFLKAKQLSPKEKTVLLSLANYYRATNQNDKAEAVLKNAVSLLPSERQIYIGLVDFYSRNGRFDDAVKVLRDVQASTPQDPEPSLILSDLYNSKDRRADGRKVLLETKEKFPQDFEVAVKVALNFLEDQPDRARAEVDQIMKQDPKNPVGPALLGELQFFAGQYDAAEATLSKPPAVDSPYPQVHFFLGNIEMRKGQADQAIFHYQKSLTVNSAYLPARVALAEVFLSKGRLDDAKQEIQKSLDARSDYGPARFLKATVDAADKNNKDAEQELTSLAKDQPANAMVYRQTGLYYESRGKIADAEKNLVRALDLQPNSQQFLRDLTLFYIRQKQADRAIQRINAIPDDKKEAFQYELLGIAYSQLGKSEEAQNAYKKALQKDPAHTSSDVYLFGQYMKDGQTENGLSTLDDLIKKHPEADGAYAARGIVLESQGKIQEAKQNYQQAIKVNPNSQAAANNLAYLLAEEGKDLNAALGYAQTARKGAPESPDIADTLGWVYYKLGNYVLAQEQFRFAISKQPDSGTFQYHLGLTEKAMKQNSEAIAALKRAINSKKDFKEKALAQAAVKELESQK